MNVKNIILTSAIIMIGLIGGAYLAFNQGQSVPEFTTINTTITTPSTSHDWGEIGIDNGNVSQTFQINNKGEETLILSNIATSCMCTTAQLQKGEDQSPLFGMHTESSYIMELQPGESASINVTFDPAFHGPSGVGPITRLITVKTNDKTQPELTFTLTAMVRSNIE